MSEVDVKTNYCVSKMSNEAYHAVKPNLSRSVLMDFNKSPYTYWANHVNPDRPPKKNTPAMQFGSAFHTLILEPHLFDEQFIVLPERVLLKDSGREAYDEYKKTVKQIEEKGQVVLDAEEMKTLKRMQQVFLSNPKAAQLVSDARIEDSFFWKEKETGLFLKARPDILHDNMIVDIKTCSDASDRAFQSSMVMGGYHIQGAMIRDGVEAVEGSRINSVINICIETTYPHNMAIYLIDECAIDEGQVKYKSILLEFKNAIEHNSFQDYGIQTIGLPRWA